MKTEEVREALKSRHSQDRGWVWLEEPFNIDFLALACHGQYGQRDRALALATHPWVGYEIKVSRSDFLHELKKPEKRAWAVAITHEFYFCAPKGLIKPSEVPGDCGLVEVHPTGSTVVMPAPITEAKPLSHLHLAQMFRHGWSPGWLRSMAEVKRRERYKRKAAEAAWLEARDREARALEALELYGRTGIAPGSSWTRRRPRSWLPDRVTVSEVGERLVRLESPAWDVSVRQSISEFLIEFTPTERSEKMVA